MGVSLRERREVDVKGGKRYERKKEKGAGPRIVRDIKKL